MKVTFAAMIFVLALGGSATAQNQGAGAPPPSSGHGKMAQSCGADLQKFCPTAQDRKARKKCIRENKSQLSQTCSAFLAEKREKHEEKKQAAAAASPAGSAPPPPAGGSGH
jgi:hypothetical protein